MRPLAAGLWLLAGLALADIPPRDTSGCRDAKAGDACKTDDGKAGACANSKCSRKRYEKGQPLKFFEVDCLRCAAPGADAGTSTKP